MQAIINFIIFNILYFFSNQTAAFQQLNQSIEFKNQELDTFSELLNSPNQLDIVFLVDASNSVGSDNFQHEISFVKIIIYNLRIIPEGSVRVAVVTFGGDRQVFRNIDQITREEFVQDKCHLLDYELNNINYLGGGTYTRGALLEACKILDKTRGEKKIVILITDGFSNGGDPRPAANLLKNSSTTIFIFGIRTGNVEELEELASLPSYAHTFFLHSFLEFQTLARRASYRDAKASQYLPVNVASHCDSLCRDEFASCACDIATGRYTCLCPMGYFGSGYQGFCQPCPNGTYASGNISGDSSSSCIPCPDANHITIKVPAISVEDCTCSAGFAINGHKCEVITCPKLVVPENGYLVKASACNNVVNAACGIRCKIGFYLTGDSIRLCHKNGSWSGDEPQCLLKTCPALYAPLHGEMSCRNEDDFHNESLIEDSSTTFPIDTRCQFKCDIGHQLRGSKARNCLPLSRWDGLKATCKGIKCDPLEKIQNSEISPKECTGPEKVSFETNCSISCNKGFTLEGPYNRICNGRAGVWTERHIVNRCVDKIAPVITCPPNMSVKTFPGTNYAILDWPSPVVVDNADNLTILWTKPYLVLPWKVKIGSRTIVYIAQDSSGNKSKCKFKVNVVDNEPPTIENCIGPQIFANTKIIVWEEPIFYDNSGLPVQVVRYDVPVDNHFPLGTTTIFYNATDKYNNIAVCQIDIVVQDVCTNLSIPTNGGTQCSNDSTNNLCRFYCLEGYAFAIEPYYLELIDNDLLLKCNRTWNENYTFPDCSEFEIPKSISRVGNVILDGNVEEICNDTIRLEQLKEQIQHNLAKESHKVCENRIKCDVVSYDPKCIEEHNNDNSLRKRRSKHNPSNKVNRKDRIHMKFEFIGETIEKNVGNPKLALQKLRETIQSMTNSGDLNLLDNQTNYEIAKIALNLEIIFKEAQETCEPGSVFKKHLCVKCPIGTYQDPTKNHCQSCPFGTYQNITGSLSCEPCPKNTSTKRMHSKSRNNCIDVCRPGYYSHRKQLYHEKRLSLEPCSPCKLGLFQSDYGRDNCSSCPLNQTTKTLASASIKDCLESDHDNLCKFQPCKNQGRCIQNEFGDFSCDCLDHFVGSKCETFKNPCDLLNSCLNGGTCIFQTNRSENVFHRCICPPRYTGRNCESYVDECLTNPCENGGKCITDEKDYSCECKPGFEGRICETPMNHCDPSPCEEGSTCRIFHDTWDCICRPGFLGRHCNLLPCDWLPCESQFVCQNIQEENATIDSYRCECLEGYFGADCSKKINYCANSPCLNNGKCIDLPLKYVCDCDVPFTGTNCETEMSVDYVMNFLGSSGTNNYVLIDGPKSNLSEISACMWLQSIDTANYGTIISYATELHDNAFTLIDYNGFVLFVNGRKILTDIKANDGYWHFICVNWENKYGSWNIYLDGNLKNHGESLAIGTFIQANGSLVIGQEQDRVGGGFSESESFFGKLSLVDIWDTIFNDQYFTQILFNTCEKYHGTLFAWSQMQYYVHGNIQITRAEFCQGCPLPVTPVNGYVNVSDDLSEIAYYCEIGFVIDLEGHESQYLKRRCLKQGIWEGYYHSPIACTAIKCEVPKYFPRGRIHGTSFSFGDEIRYSCDEGHVLRGNPLRICNSEGKWSGLPPICIGKTCKNLLAPDNGDIEYIIEEHERDDISILQVGQQLEFTCNSGYQLIGEKSLVCLESGSWDHKSPKCIPYGCPFPNITQHHYVSSLMITDEIEKSYSYESKDDELMNKNFSINDVLGLSCIPGFKFQDSRNDNDRTIIQYKIQCSSETNGWIGSLADCVHLQCPPFEEIPNAKLIITNKNEMEELSTGARILIACEKGFELIGKELRICTNEGFWSPSNQSFCQSRKCPIKKHPIFSFFNFELLETRENQTIVVENFQIRVQGIDYGNEIILQCQDNLMGSIVTWYCNEMGEWSNGDTNFRNYNWIDHCKTRKCFVPEVPEHGYIINEKEENVSEIVTFGCKEGYHLEGNATSICLINNTWSTIPTCKPITCEKPRKLANALSMRKETYNIGNIISYQCSLGYRVLGKLGSICLPSGKWSKINGKCSKISCGKPKTEAGITVFGRSYLYQDQLIYICPDRVKRKIITCKYDGQWSDLPNCGPLS